MYNYFLFADNRNGDLMNIKEIMTKSIIYADIDNSIEDVCNIMKTYDIGFLPIKDNGEFVGIITDRDIVTKAISQGEEITNPIKPFITTHIVSIDIDSKLEEAIKLMSDYQIRRIMIKNRNKFVGIIALSDILSIKHDFDILKYISKIFMPNDKVVFTNDIDLQQAEIDEFEL